MSDFNRIYKSILTEGRIPSIFKMATPEELAERAVHYEKIRVQEFLERKDIRRNKDGSYDVDGNVDFSELKTITKLPVRFGKVGRSFFCSDCTSLTSLEGAPTTVGWSFNCSDCPSLTSLEGAPTTVGGCFWCNGCGRKFTVEEVRKHCDVKGDIHV